MTSLPASIPQLAKRGTTRLLRRAVAGAHRIDAALLQRSELLQAVRYESRNARDFSELWRHEEMLASSIRTNAYLSRLYDYIPVGGTALDFGTGTGVFAQAMSDYAAVVYAIDHSAPMIALARAIARRNNRQNIVFIQSHSSDVQLPEQVDLIVHEQMGSYLIDEAMIPNVIDLRDRWLRPGGRILPNYFELYVEPIQLIPAWRVPFIWEQRLDGMRTNHVSDLIRSGAGVRRRRLVPYSAIDTVLGHVEPAWTFDLERLASSDIPASLHIDREIAVSGRLDGLAVWFSAGTSRETWFSTHPSVPQIPWPLPIERLETREVRQGDRLRYTVTMRPTTLDEIALEP